MQKRRFLAIVIVVIIAFATMASCKKECTHTYVDGKCSNCGIVCTHNYTDGVCDTCKEECTHTYENGICTVCGITCSHTYEEGVCSDCGKVCLHNYVDGVCTACKIVCTHNYVDGVCTVCGTACSHNYAEGVCTVCGTACAHNYTEGVCSVCGAKDKDYVSADGVSLYSDIVAKFKDTVIYKDRNEALPPKAEDAPYYVDAIFEVVSNYTPAMEMGYAYKDIDGDGWKELFLLSRDTYVYGMFTIKDGKPVVVGTFQQGQARVCPDGTIYAYEKNWDAIGGQISLEYTISNLVDGELVLDFAFGWDDADGDSTTDDSVYFKKENGTKTELTYDEYKVYRDNRYEYYLSYGSRLGKTANLHFRSALTDTTSTTTKADFSSYDAIIKTFGLMHSEVAGGKYERPKWISGQYDTGMLFDSEEEFITYNRILGAIVLVQNSSTAKFGYVKTDMNKDGIDELLLTDNKMNVFAIFTQVDGSPVLVETFTDLKYACVDSDGKVYVANRMLPGNKKDFEYSVCTLVGTKLVASLTIGITYEGSTTTPNGWYKYVNGVATVIEQSEYDEAFETYFKSKASTVNVSNFAKYTLNNAGLTFVQVSPVE